MTEKQIKELYKIAVEKGNQTLSKEQKEIIKQAIDNSRTVEELLVTAIVTNLIS